MSKQEERQAAFKRAQGSLLGLLAYVIRYRPVILLSLIAMIIAGYILASNIKYSREKGLEWVPSISATVKVGGER